MRCFRARRIEDGSRPAGAGGWSRGCWTENHQFIHDLFLARSFTLVEGEREGGRTLALTLVRRVLSGSRFCSWRFTLVPCSVLGGTPALTPALSRSGEGEPSAARRLCDRVRLAWDFAANDSAVARLRESLKLREPAAIASRKLASIPRYHRAGAVRAPGGAPNPCSRTTTTWPRTLPPHEART